MRTGTRALRKEPGERYASAAGLASDLDALEDWIVGWTSLIDPAGRASSSAEQFLQERARVPPGPAARCLRLDPLGGRLGVGRVGTGLAWLGGMEKTHRSMIDPVVGKFAPRIVLEERVFLEIPNTTLYGVRPFLSWYYVSKGDAKRIGAMKFAIEQLNVCMRAAMLVVVFRSYLGITGMESAMVLAAAYALMAANYALRMRACTRGLVCVGAGAVPQGLSVIRATGSAASCSETGNRDSTMSVQYARA